MTVDWRTLPSLAALRAFDATARHGGFTGAGRALNVTHAAIAQQVRALEREIGAPLVERQGRAVGLTQDGQRLAQSLAEGFGTIADGVTALQQSQRQRGLRVATTPYFAQALILPRLAEFWARHPGIEVSMTPSQTLVDVVRDGFDMAIRMSQDPVPGLETVFLAQARVLVAGAPSLLGDGSVDVLTLPWIWSPDWVREAAILRAAGFAIDPLIKVDVGSEHLEIAAAVQGIGLIIANEIVVRAELASGQLREVAVPGLPHVSYYAVLPSGPHRPAVQHFLDWVKTLF